jgi:beta-galactosidase
VSLLDRLAFGSSYYPPHHDPADWPRDLDRMIECGLDTIRSAELLASWDRIEVAKHEYDFDWLDRLFELAGERGIRILLGTGTCCPPIWMASEYPDLPVVSRDGVPYPTGAMWSWACKDHPGYLEEVERWIGVLAGRYGARPELLGWQIDNEPGYPFIPRAGLGMDVYCYCSHTEERFREWLRARYETPEALSDAWRWDPTNQRFSDWSQVRPPRATPAEWGVVTAWLDWRLFIADDLAGVIAWQHDLLRTMTPGLPTSTNGFIWSRNDPFGVRMGQDPWRLARSADAIGYDLYPGIERRFLEHPEYVGMYLDYARSSAKWSGAELWLSEIESGPLNGWVLGPDHATSADDIVRINADCLGAGAQLVLYQGYREWNCIPIHWGALVDLKGRPTKRLGAATAVARAVEPHSALFLEAAARQAGVALLHDFDNAVVVEGMGAGDVLLDALSGAYSALGGGGFEVEFVSFAELDRLECRLLVLPFAMVVPGHAGEAIAEYVRRGGSVLAFAKVAMLDGRGWYWDVRPGAGLDELFGVEEEEIAVDEGPIALDVPAGGRLPGWDGGRVDGYRHRQALRVREGTEVLGTFEDGSPALTFRAHGEGGAYLVATHADLAVKRLGSSAAASLLCAVAVAAGARRLFEARPAPDGKPRLWARLRSAGGRGILTVSSSADDESEARVGVRASSARDLVTGEELAAEDGFLRVPVRPRSARIVLLEGVE